MKKGELVRFKVTGESFYSHISKPIKDGLSKGKFGVGISNIKEIVTDYKENEEEILAFFKNEFVNEGVISGINNSKYPIPLYNEKNEKIDSTYIPNGSKIQVIFRLQKNEHFNKNYLVVEGVKLLEEIKSVNPFTDYNF